MSTPFKMKGWSPFHQEKKAKVTSQKTEEKFRLMSSTRNDGTIEYFKIDSEGNKIKISEATYNQMKG